MVRDQPGSRQGRTRPANTCTCAELFGAAPQKDTSAYRMARTSPRRHAPVSQVLTLAGSRRLPTEYAYIILLAIERKYEELLVQRTEAAPAGKRAPARVFRLGPPTVDEFEAAVRYVGWMSSPRVPGGVVHKLPGDLRDALIANAAALDAWNDITPLARNEFICWVEDAKQEATRQRRIRRTQEELEEGQRRPCCWPGCKHRERTGR